MPYNLEPGGTYAVVMDRGYTGGDPAPPDGTTVIWNIYERTPTDTLVSSNVTPNDFWFTPGEITPYGPPGGLLFIDFSAPEDTYLLMWVIDADVGAVAVVEFTVGEAGLPAPVMTAQGRLSSNVPEILLGVSG